MAKRKGRDITDEEFFRAIRGGEAGKDVSDKEYFRYVRKHPSRHALDLEGTKMRPHYATGSFKDAFAAARRAYGHGHGKFTWHGSPEETVYSTAYAGEDTTLDRALEARKNKEVGMVAEGPSKEGGVPAKRSLAYPGRVTMRDNNVYDLALEDIMGVPSVGSGRRKKLPIRERSTMTGYQGGKPVRTSVQDLGIGPAPVTRSGVGSIAKVNATVDSQEQGVDVAGTMRALDSVVEKEAAVEAKDVLTSPLLIDMLRSRHEYPGFGRDHLDIDWTEHTDTEAVPSRRPRIYGQNTRVTDLALGNPYRSRRASMEAARRDRLRLLREKVLGKLYHNPRQRAMHRRMDVKY